MWGLGGYDCLLRIGLIMDIKQIESNAEIIALCNYLSSCPVDMPYDTVIEKLHTLDHTELSESGIDVWQPFEYHDPHDIAGYIQDLYDSIVYRFTLKESAHGSIHNT